MWLMECSLTSEWCPLLILAEWCNDDIICEADDAIVEEDEPWIDSSDAAVAAAAAAAAATARWSWDMEALADVEWRPTWIERVL